MTASITTATTAAPVGAGVYQRDERRQRHSLPPAPSPGCGFQRLTNSLHTEGAGWARAGNSSSPSAASVVPVTRCKGLKAERGVFFGGSYHRSHSSRSAWRSDLPLPNTQAALSSHPRQARAPTGPHPHLLEATTGCSRAMLIHTSSRPASPSPGLLFFWLISQSLCFKALHPSTLRQ